MLRCDFFRPLAVILELTAKRANREVRNLSEPVLLVLLHFNRRLIHDRAAIHHVDQSALPVRALKVVAKSIGRTLQHVGHIFLFTELETLQTIQETITVSFAVAGLVGRPSASMP